MFFPPNIYKGPNFLEPPKNWRGTSFPDFAIFRMFGDLYMPIKKSRVKASENAESVQCSLWRRCEQSRSAKMQNARVNATHACRALCSPSSFSHQKNYGAWHVCCSETLLKKAFRSPNGCRFQFFCVSKMRIVAHAVKTAKLFGRAHKTQVPEKRIVLRTFFLTDLTFHSSGKQKEVKARITAKRPKLNALNCVLAL